VKDSSSFSAAERLESLKAGAVAAFGVFWGFGAIALANSLILAQRFDFLAGLQVRAIVCDRRFFLGLGDRAIDYLAVGKRHCPVLNCCSSRAIAFRPASYDYLAVGKRQCGVLLKLGHGSAVSLQLIGRWLYLSRRSIIWR